MKKGIYIVLFLFGLVVVSCSKQEITPNVEAEQTPEWVSNRSFDENGGRSGEDGGGITFGKGNGNPTSNGDITDPNIDPDGE